MCENARRKRAYYANIERERSRLGEYRKKNKEKLRAARREYLRKNREKINEKNKRYQKHRRRTDPMFKLRQSISSGVWHALRDNKAGRSWEQILDYTLSDLKKHLESQFKDGMTWENYGDWHIDHIIPIAKHNFTTDQHEDFKRCWALSNLQPLWAEENFSKNAKINKPFQPRLAI
jgi:hypothetical protein